MNIDLEKYLNGEMGEEERLCFEQKLESSPALRAELEVERALLDRLKTQMLRERIAAALAGGGGENPPEKNNRETLALAFGRTAAGDRGGVLVFWEKRGRPARGAARQTAGNA